MPNMGSIGRMPWSDELRRSAARDHFLDPDVNRNENVPCALFDSAPRTATPDLQIFSNNIPTAIPIEHNLSHFRTQDVAVATLLDEMQANRLGVHQNAWQHERNSGFLLNQNQHCCTIC